MKENLLIVKDDHVLASDLQSMPEMAGYQICAIVDTVAAASPCRESRIYKHSYSRKPHTSLWS